MSLSALLTGVLFILWGINELGLVAVSGAVLGLLALITGVVWIVSVFYPISFPARRV